MPYRELTDLPEAVRSHLPHHAQEIFQAAFNHAYDEYDGREETAFKVAWSAVERKYRKDERTGQWVERDR